MFRLDGNSALARALFTILVVALGLSGFFVPVGTAATPVPDATNSPSIEDIQFTMVPVGDHPLGYFSDVQVAPGESVELEVAVINTGSVAVDLRVYGTNASNEINGGFVAGYLGDVPNGSTLWMEFEEAVFTLDPTAEYIFPFTVSVPHGTEPGQYISAMVVETATAIELPGSEVLDQVVRFALSVGVLVPGEITHSYELGAPDIVDHLLSIPITNTGNYLVRPAGTLTLVDESDDEIVVQPLQLGSIYGGNVTSIELRLPDQIPSGEYSLNLKLEDPDSGALAQLENAQVVIPEPEDPTGVYLREHAVEPNAAPIVYADVSVLIDNGGQQLNSVDVMLIVVRDGETVEEFPLATNQTFITGENTLVSRYLPADMWMAGTYTFSIEVHAVDPNTGQRIELLTDGLDAEIVVP